jgi:hypothetical protein
MSDYHVTYSIDLDAESPREAAITVWRWMQDPASFLPALDVTVVGEDGLPLYCTIDVEEYRRELGLT